MAIETLSLKDHLAAGEAAQAAGNIADALGHFAAVLAEVPDHARVKKAVLKLRKDAGAGTSLTQNDVNQVIQMMQAGHFKMAADQARLLQLLAPREALLFNILGMCLVNLNAFQDAVNSFTRATKINPNYAEAYANLGAALVQLGLFEKADPHLSKARKLNDKMPEVHHNLAVVRRSQGRHDEALEAAERALTLVPDYPNALNTKGTILRDVNRFEEALAAFEAGLALEPTNSDLQINHGFAVASMGDVKKAIDLLEKALPTASNTAEIDHRLGVLHSELGQTEEALARLTKAITTDPSQAEGFRTLSVLKKFQADDPLIAQMEASINAEDCPDSAKLHLGFALGKAFEDIGDYDKAFHYLKIGNAEKRKTVAFYTTQNRLARVEDIKTTFTRAFADGLKAGASASKRPIFVVGMNRSGTTLVEQVISSHSDVFGAGELTWIEVFGQKNWDNFKSWAPEDISGFAEGYLAHITGKAGNAARVTDKLPINFNWIGLIKAAFPNAKIVNLTRDPRDNCLSIYKNHFESRGNQYAYDLEELAEFYLTYRDLMDHWHQEFPGEIYDISYEALTSDQENETRKLMQYLDLPWEDQVLEFHKNTRAVRTASVGQVREKMYQSSVQSWRHFETGLKPLIDILEAAGRLPEQEQA